MADHAAPSYSKAKGNDYTEHEKTYAMFTAMAKWGTIAVAALLVIMALTLV